MQAKKVTVQAVFWQDLQDEQYFGKPVVCPFYMNSNV